MRNYFFLLVVATCIFSCEDFTPLPETHLLYMEYETKNSEVVSSGYVEATADDNGLVLVEDPNVTNETNIETSDEVELVQVTPGAFWVRCIHNAYTVQFEYRVLKN